MHLHIICECIFEHNQTWAFIKSITMVECYSSYAVQSGNNFMVAGDVSHNTFAYELVCYRYCPNFV